MYIVYILYIYIIWASLVAHMVKNVYIYIYKMGASQMAEW